MPSRTSANLILASQSAYRQAQLRQLGLPFTTAAAHINEEVLADENAQQAAVRLAKTKTLKIANEHANYYIIGCDQTAGLDDIILGKPGTEENAFNQLMQCQARTVTFYSALCVYSPENKQLIQHCTQTNVSFRQLIESQIRSYIQRESPLDCAGSFKCEGLGISLFESIQSDDPSALIGLPLIALCTALQHTPFQPI